jgi:oligopeptide transport system ATP-binding protein
VLEIEALDVSFRVPGGELAAVSDFSLALEAAECIGIVGESGAGKSQALLAVMGLLAPNARVSGRARLAGEELIGASAQRLRELRGASLAMIFQDPMTSLTPHLRIGEQIAETLVHHRGLSAGQARQRALALLERVHVTDAPRRLRQYPHELSGGMRQRVMIAIALACEPRLLIADEPTTALDVTIQAQILALLAALKREQGMALALITHDLGIVAGIADRVVVMYAGRIVEQGSVREILRSPQHPYTAALLASMPRIDAPLGAQLESIRGQPPNPRALPSGCPFHPRCDLADALCAAQRPPLAAPDRGGHRAVACHRPLAPRSGA